MNGKENHDDIIDEKLKPVAEILSQLPYQFLGHSVMNYNIQKKMCTLLLYTYDKSIVETAKNDIVRAIDNKGIRQPTIIIQLEEYYDKENATLLVGAFLKKYNKNNTNTRRMISLLSLMNQKGKINLASFLNEHFQGNRNPGNSFTQFRKTIKNIGITLGVEVEVIIDSFKNKSPEDRYVGITGNYQIIQEVKHENIINKLIDYHSEINVDHYIPNYATKIT